MVFASCKRLSFCKKVVISSSGRKKVSPKKLIASPFFSGSVMVSEVEFGDMEHAMRRRKKAEHTMLLFPPKSFFTTFGIIHLRYLMATNTSVKVICQAGHYFK
jgi:hypothetical protein